MVVLNGQLCISLAVSQLLLGWPHPSMFTAHQGSFFRHDTVEAHCGAFFYFLPLAIIQSLTCVADDKIRQRFDLVGLHL